MKIRYILPLTVFAVLVGFLYAGLYRDPRLIPSPLINKPAPDFKLPTLVDPQQTFSRNDMLGKVWLFNVWASWCVSCREEHPLLMAFSKAAIVPIYGMDYKDNGKDAQQWLDQRGNPYVKVLTDRDGRVGLDYGVYGVPETYLIDKKGIIRYKQIGPLTTDVIENKIIPMVKELRG
ncbi:MAG TPA: DsbE family thiol:disulfide interchange protein [Gammaproteobacteria bacterium]|nr:DsbE family thiol:disulfide interchange protein [Gammaproteobacteria bacterium]